MKIELIEDRRIKGRFREAGETVTVLKDLGERLISKGLANRIIVGKTTENRITAASEDRGRRRFHGYKLFEKRFKE